MIFLSTDSLIKIRIFCVQELCSTADVAYSGKRPDNQIRKGFEWLIDAINTNYDFIQKRVSKDSSAQKAEEERDKKEKRDRVNKLREERFAIVNKYFKL